jgi:hypothetical protein
MAEKETFYCYDCSEAKLNAASKTTMEAIRVSKVNP